MNLAVIMQNGKQATNTLTALRLAQGRAACARPRIDKLLDATYTSKLVLVEACRGSGATTAVAAWAAREVDAGKAYVVWIDIDNETSDEKELAGALAEELEGTLGFQTIDEGAMRCESIAKLLAQLGGGLPPGIHLVVVLDNYRPELTAKLNGPLDACVATLPSATHVICIATHRPPLSLTLRRAMGQAAVINAADLAFTPSETRELVSQDGGRACSASAARAICDACRGWATGIKIVCLGIREAPFALLSIDARHYAQLDAVAQFARESLAQLDEETRGLALEAAALGRVNLDMASAALKWDEAKLAAARLEDKMPCLAVVQNTLVCQPLLTAAFDELFESEDPCRRTAAHRAALDWLVQRGDYTDALPHALALGDWKLAVKAAAETGRLLIERAEIGRFEGLEDIDAASCAGKQADLACMKVGSLLASGKTEQALKLAKLIAQEGDLGAGCLIDPFSEVLASRQELSYSAVLTQLLARMGCFGRALEIGMSAYRHKDILSPHERCWLSIGLGHAVSSAAPGNKAVAFLENELGFARRGHLLSLELFTGFLLANQYLDRLKLTRAEEICTGLLESIERASVRMTPLCLLPQLELAKIDMWRGNSSASKRFLERDASKLAELGDPCFQREALLLESELLRLEHSYEESLVVLRELVRQDGDTERINAKQATAQLFASEESLVREQFEKSFAALDSKELPEDEIVQLARCRILVRSKPDQAAKRAEALVKASRSDGRDAVLVQALLVQAVALQRTGELRASDRAASEAVRLAAREGAALPFLGGEGVHVPLLERLLETGNVNGAMLTPTERRFAEWVLQITPRPTSETAPNPLERDSARLTAREGDVMRLLANGFTMEQAASEMGVSLSTVNTHRANLYAKLGIHTRRQLKALYEQMRER